MIDKQTIANMVAMMHLAQLLNRLGVKRIVIGAPTRCESMRLPF